MKIEHGNFQVVRACCQSGNCVACLGRWVKARRKRVVQLDGLSEATAKIVASNFAAYDATVEPMT